MGNAVPAKEYIRAIKDMGELRDYAERLEAALRKIAEAAPLIGGDAYAMRNIAREALGDNI